METTPPVPSPEPAVQRVSLADIDAALAAIGGLAGVPMLASSVASMLPGASMPPEWLDWLSERATAREPFTVEVTAPSGRWRLEVSP